MFCASLLWLGHEPEAATLTQGFKSEEEHHIEIEITMIRARIDEQQEATMVRFLESLNKEIANILELQNYVDLEETVHKVIQD